MAKTQDINTKRWPGCGVTGTLIAGMQNVSATFKDTWKISYKYTYS